MYREKMYASYSTPVTESAMEWLFENVGPNRRLGTEQSEQRRRRPLPSILPTSETY